MALVHKRIMTISACLTCWGGLAFGTQACAEPFVFDPGYTALVFSWSHLGLSRQQARFNGIDGHFDLDPQSPERSRFDVTIRTASVQTGNDGFDRILRGPDFFNAATFPTMTFRSAEIVRTGEKTADVTGELEIMDRVKPVVLHVTLSLFGEHPAAAANPSYAGRKVAAFSAKAEIVRSDWGLGRGTPLVSDNIEIDIETELVSAP
jgi:polyisoprenoid-binding protein YceI